MHCEQWAQAPMTVWIVVVVSTIFKINILKKVEKVKY